MAFRDDHEAAVQRAEALARELGHAMLERDHAQQERDRAQQERDRLWAEVELLRKAVAPHAQPTALAPRPKPPVVHMYPNPPPAKVSAQVFAVMTGVFATIALAALYDHMFLMLGFGALVSWAALAIDKHRVREAKQLATGRPDVRR